MKLTTILCVFSLLLSGCLSSQGQRQDSPVQQVQTTTRFDHLMSFSDFIAPVGADRRYDFSGVAHSIAWVAADSADAALQAVRTQLHNAILGALPTQLVATTQTFDQQHRRDYAVAANTTDACLPTGNTRDKDSFPCTVIVLFDRPVPVMAPPFIGSGQRYLVRVRFFTIAPQGVIDASRFHAAVVARLGHWFVHYIDHNTIEFAGDHLSAP